MDRPGGGSGGAAGGLPRDDAHRLPGRGPGAARLVRDGIDAGGQEHCEPAGRGGPGGDDGRDRVPRPTGLPAGAPLDAAAVLHGGAVAITSAKHHLPNYGVFDEYRYFVPGHVLPVIRVAAAGGPADVAVAICEDLWQDGGPVTVARQARAGLLVVPNASPYERGKGEARLALCRRRAAEAGAALAYVNMIGGQDELVFDGDSIIVTADGTLLARGPQFEEALIVADVDLPPAAGEAA